MNQDKIMKGRMLTFLVLWIITLIGLLVFIGLYIDETKRVQETYRNQYVTELTHTKQEIDKYIENQGDLDQRYRRICNYMSSANAFIFLIEDMSEQQKTINEITTCLIRYPEQMSGKLQELDTALEDIIAGLDKGYEEADAIVESINKQGN